MRERRRVIALAMCIAIALSMAVSSACIAHEAIHPHDCTGEDCPVCQALNVCRSVVMSFFTALIIMFMPVSGAFSPGFAECERAVRARFSPVELKVRLLN